MKSLNTSIRLFAGMLLLSCANPGKPLSIVPLVMLNYSDTTNDRGMIVNNKADFYLVRGYVDNRKTLNYIDSFVEKNRDRSMVENSNYSIIFYKESKQTNVENILANPRVIDRYSQENDQVYRYLWMNGRFLTRYKIRKGRIVEPKSDIKVEDVK